MLNSKKDKELTHVAYLFFQWFFYDSKSKVFAVSEIQEFSER